MDLTNETLDDFMDRTYVNFTKSKVLVFPTSKRISIAEQWSLRKTYNYISYLKSKNETNSS